LRTIIPLIVLSIIFDIFNGLRDGSNFVSTMISSRTMSMRNALSIAAIAEFLGPFIFGVAVARTFGKGLFAPNSVTILELIAALLSATLWNIITWLLSFPSSSTHALLGAIIGSVLAGTGLHSISTSGISKILLSLFLSPPVGLLVGFLFTKLMYYFARFETTHVNYLFKRFQIFTAIILALSYGANDAQKSMGLISLGLVISGFLPDFRIPIWVIVLSAGSIALGILLGGQRLIRTLGGRFYKIQPVEGFSSQFSSTAVILGAALAGGPVSSSQVITSSILGAGSADRVNKIRWGFAGHIVESWLLTIPVCMLMAFIIYELMARIIP
jgi:PiT family inorganic phosphate transporter